NRILGRKDSIHTFLDSQTVDLTVLPLPSIGRPVDFTGVIGNFTFDIDAEPLRVKSGGKVMFTMEIKGEGNYNTVSPPLVERKEGISLSPAIAEKISDGMIFRQEMTVTSPTVKELPLVRFIFFDPSKREYIVSAGGGDPIEVEGPPEGKAKESEDARGKISEESRPGLVRLKDGPGRFSRGDPVILQKGAITFLLTAPLCLIVGAMAVQKRAKKLESDKPYAAWLKASRRARRDIAELNGLIREGAQGDFYDKVFRTMQEYLGIRLFTASAGISDDVIEVLRASGGISGEETGKIKTLFDECYMARYAPLKFDVEDMKNTYGSLKEIIGALDGRRRL
ncbi:MAG: hypothetical protein PHT95_02810, partial [Candidatus Omnitrophica bacterium]|nr:hypothetical protein [Candidatus Omnitrophota bacterium]